MIPFYFVLLVVGAFLLGACPFSLWIGKWLLAKDIRDYGDGNPGAYNVFRAGGRKSGVLALFADIGKGVPFVYLAHYVLGLPMAMVMGVGLAAILGHAYSPFLGFKGGKALAVTGGVLLAMPQHEMVLSALVFMLLAFLFVHGDAWRVMCGLGASAIYVAVSGGLALEPLFMLCIIAIIAVKHFKELRTTTPAFGGAVGNFLRARKARG